MPVFELASVPLHVDAFDGERWHFQWINAEPFPLGQLLNQEYLHEAVTSCLKQNPISNRIRIAARWFAEAHYSLADDDAALALGVAMDAMLTGPRAMPGSAVADRFALLAEDSNDRRERSFRQVTMSMPGDRGNLRGDAVAAVSCCRLAVDA
jgi:hypothetical protein